MTMNNDEGQRGCLYSIHKLTHMVHEASRSVDPDVQAALENLEEVLARSKSRNRNATAEPVTVYD